MKKRARSRPKAKAPIRRSKHKTIKKRKKAVKQEKAAKSMPQKKAPSLGITKAGYVETSIDKLLDMVQKKGRISLSYAAHKLNYPRSEVEEWAKALSEHGLMKVDYTLFGTFLRRIDKK
jgi:hypothetical protein